MPIATIDGIPTRYEVHGSGTPLLMFSPGGFNARLDNWSELGVYQRLELIPRLSRDHTCIVFDRREAGESGGRVERLRWGHYVAQGLGLLDHLGIDDAHLMGGCVGCSTAAEFAVQNPARTRSLVLYSPAGGARYRMGQHARFRRHLAFVEDHGLAAVVDLARSTDLGFSKDPRGGPWVEVLRRDLSFAEAYASLDVERYATTVVGSARLLFDRDSVPGVEPEDLLALETPALVVPGEDASHAPSAAHFLAECLPRSQHWAVPVADQDAGSATPRIAEFLAEVDVQLGGGSY